MNVSTMTTTASSTSAATARQITFEEMVCTMVAASVYDNVQKYLSTATAMPLHVLIVFLLFLRVAKRRFYHFLIIAQCVTDIWAMGCIFVTHSLCVVFKKLVANWFIDKTAPFQMVLTIYLMIYWKNAIRPQRLLDIFFYIISVLSVLGSIADKVFRQYNQQPTPISLLFIGVNTFANLTLTAMCLAMFILVMKMDVSYFTEVTLKGQKKMATALLLQFILILISNIVDVFLSYGNYYIINNADVFNANLLASNVTDPAVLEQLQQEYRQHTTFFLDILEKSTTVSATWSAFLPLFRGILIYWAIKPLLQKRTVVIISRSTTDI